jgi:hypothetical protein
MTNNPQLGLQMKVEIWRAKARAGTMTMEDMKEAVKALRAGRSLISQATGGSKTNAKAKAAKPNGDDLLSELEGL